MKHVLVLLVTCLGCGDRTGKRTPTHAAEPPPVLTTLAIGLAQGSSICPNAYPLQQLIVTGKTAGGRALTTGRDRDGLLQSGEYLLPPERFRITASAGTISPLGVYQPPAASMALAETAFVDFRVDDLVQPELSAAAHMPVDFKCGAFLSLRGRNGAPGGEGESGHIGWNGASVDVALVHLASQVHGDMILARVDGPTGRFYFLLQPGGGPLTIDLRGGDGGRGGDGERQVLSYSSTGFNGTPQQSTYIHEGPPGLGGAGGQGGTATIHFDATDPLLTFAIRVFNGGGYGGFSEAGRGAAGFPGPPVRVVADNPKLLFADELQRGFPIALKMMGVVSRR